MPNKSETNIGDTHPLSPINTLSSEDGLSSNEEEPLELPQDLAPKEIPEEEKFFSARDSPRKSPRENS